MILNNFEDNTINLSIPPAAYGKEWIEINFKLPNAVSPKELGQGEDGRKLGVGLKRVKFE